MSMYAEMVDKLAVEVIAAAEEIGDERLPETIAQAIGASSPTTEELFRTAVRVRTALNRAYRVLGEQKARHAAQAAAPAAPAAQPPQ